MANQLGYGQTDGQSIPGPLYVGGAVIANGVTAAPAKATIATVPVTCTTADIAAMGTAILALRLTLVNLGYVNA